jgi:RWD domain
MIQSDSQEIQDSAASTIIWNEAEEKLISFELIILIGQSYPYSIPSLSIRCPRGISPKQTKEMLLEINTKIERLIGSEMIFEIVELFKVILVIPVLLFICLRVGIY